MPRDRGPKAGRMVFARVALGAAMLALCVSGYASSVRAQDPDNRTASEKFMDALGLKNPFATDYEINYSERSPLVVPPNRNLPPPVSSTAPPVANWPVNPETKQRQAKEEKPTPRPYDSVMNAERGLTPAELGVGRPVSAPG